MTSQTGDVMGDGAGDLAATVRALLVVQIEHLERERDARDAHLATLQELLASLDHEPPARIPSGRSPQTQDERLAEVRARTAAAQARLAALEEDHASDDGPASEAEARESQEDLHDAAAITVLSGPCRELAEQLSWAEQHSLTHIRAVAMYLGLVPLDAIRTINEWAATLTSGTNPSDGAPDAVLEVDEVNDSLWVEPTLRGLLA